MALTLSQGEARRSFWERARGSADQRGSCFGFALISDTSHTSPVPSSLPDTTDCPSELKAMAFTEPRWPANRLSSRPLAMSQIRTVASLFDL